MAWGSFVWLPCLFSTDPVPAGANCGPKWGERMNSSYEQYEIVDAFAQLCAMLQPNVICDIGTCNADDAIKFKQSSPESTVFAFEANPQNYFDFCIRREVSSEGVIVQHIAISDKDSFVQMYLPQRASRDSAPDIGVRGIASTKKRVDSETYITFDMPARSLDSFFASGSALKSFALWIDLEGSAMECIRGSRAVLQNSLIVKIECENYIAWEGQATYSDILAEMLTMGFYELCSSDQSPGQFDVIFAKEGKVSRDIMSRVQIK